jgi:glycosyltransferase involved in cell wall biosynthesis
MANTIELSVIIPVSERYDDVTPVFSAYRDALSSTGLCHEFVYVLDGDYPDFQRELMELKDAGENIKIVKLARSFGEATALTVGFEHSSGDIIMTLPAYIQVEPSEYPRLISRLEDHDLVVARRWPRKDSRLNRIQTKAFHLPIKLLTGLDFQDLGCSVRVMKRRVVDELYIYGDQHRFLPLLAYKQGFRVLQVDAAQAQQDAGKRLYSFGVYLRRLLDILSIFFLLKFTKKPMRPILLLGSLLVVLGIQVFAIGLVGEIIIFTHAKELKEYTVDEIIN